MSRNGKSDGRVYRAEDLLEDPGYGGGRQSREVVRPAKRENLRVHTSPDLKPQDLGEEVGAEAPTGYQSGSLLVPGHDGIIQKNVMKFVSELPGLSDRSHVTGDDDRSPETRSREELSEFESSTLYKGTDVHVASLDVIEERRKAEEEQEKAMRKFREAREFEVKKNPHKRSDSHGSLAKSLLSKFSVGGGVFSQLFRHSPPMETRRWSFKSPLSAFGLAECLLERGKTRVRWRCVCGRKMHDDFIELRPGAAAELEKWLNHSIRNHGVNRASNPSQDYTSRSSNASSAGVSGQRLTAGSDISLQPLSRTASTMPDSDKNGAVTIDVHLEKCWLLICGQPRRGPDSLLAQLDLSSKPSDKELFDGMKELHSSLRNTFTLQPVLKGVQTIRFVQASFKN